MRAKASTTTIEVSAHVPALDGIRGVAVAAVLAFHGGLPWATGGFLGVDAFFVLSGYLITALLLAEWTRSRGRIDLAAFWGRRVRRLLPALLLMVTAVAIGARALLPPEEVRLLRGDGMASLFYVANWRMTFRGGDYFAQTAAPSPLQHTWSLGIEEQFYLLWPLVLCAVLYRRRPDRTSRRALAGGGVRTHLWWLVVVCVVGAVASTVALAVAYTAEDPGRAYYGTDTRGAGILMAISLQPCGSYARLPQHHAAGVLRRRPSRCSCSCASSAVASSACTRRDAILPWAIPNSTGRSSKQRASRTACFPWFPDFSHLTGPPNAVQRAAFDDDWVNLLFVGRVIPNKRIEDLIRWFHAYKRWFNPHSRLLLVGRRAGSNATWRCCTSFIAEHRRRGRALSRPRLQRGAGRLLRSGRHLSVRERARRASACR